LYPVVPVQFFAPIVGHSFEQQHAEVTLHA